MTPKTTRRTANPFTPLATHDDDAADNPPTSPPPPNDTDTTTLPSKPDPVLVVLTSFHVNGEPNDIDLINSIDLSTIITNDLFTLNENAYDTVKLLSLHSIFDCELCDDSTVQRFQDVLDSNLFKMSGYADTDSNKTRPITTTSQGFQRFYDDLIATYEGDYTVPTTITITLQFRLRVPKVPTVLPPSPPVSTPMLHAPPETTSDQNIPPPTHCFHGFKPNHINIQPSNPTINPSLMKSDPASVAIMHYTISFVTSILFLWIVHPRIVFPLANPSTLLVHTLTYGNTFFSKIGRAHV